jgi:uncharacterized membrane protein
MIKAIGIILIVLGAVGLIVGILGIFGTLSVRISPWALAIIGVLLLPSGTGLLKRRRDTDET